MSHFDRMYLKLEVNKQKKKELKLKRTQKRIAKYREHLRIEREISNYHLKKLNELRE